MTPWKVASASSQPMVMWPLQVNQNRSAASTSSSAWQIFTSRSFSYRSASTPACIENSTTGSEPAETTSPTRNALFVSSSASHPWAMLCIQLPTSDSVCPSQNTRKFRWRTRTLNGLTLATCEGLRAES